MTFMGDDDMEVEAFDTNEYRMMDNREFFVDWNSEQQSRVVLENGQGWRFSRIEWLAYLWPFDHGNCAC